MDWLSFVRHYNIPYRTKGKGIGQNVVAVNCPFHTPRDTDYFLGLMEGSRNEGYGNCWYCGGHKGIQIIKELTHTDWYNAKQIASEYGAGRSFLESNVVHETPVTIELPPKGNINVVERAYLHDRGITDDHITTYDLRGGGFLDPFFKYRIIIPIMDNTGRIVSARGRAIHASETIRYKALKSQDEIIPHKHLLYAEHLVYGSTIIVTESEFSAMRVGPPCVATFGTQFTPHQLLRMALYKHIIIAMDSDNAGKKASAMLADQLSVISDATVSILDIHNYAKSIGDMSDSDILYMRNRVL